MSLNASKNKLVFLVFLYNPFLIFDQVTFHKSSIEIVDNICHREELIRIGFCNTCQIWLSYHLIYWHLTHVTNSISYKNRIKPQKLVQNIDTTQSLLHDLFCIHSKYTEYIVTWVDAREYMTWVINESLRTLQHDTMTLC